MPKGEMTSKTKPRMPPKFISMAEQGNYHTGSGATEETCLEKTIPVFSKSYPPQYVGVYKLIKVLRRKETPVEVESVGEE